jgi:hypothetical protein
MAHPTYFFGNGRSEGNAGMKALLGTRGAHKCEMANLGLPVAPGFCITPKCLQSDGGGGGPPLSDDARYSIKLAVSELEDAADRRFGNLVNPLLLSVEGDLASPLQSFRGTVANIGLNDAIVQAWTAHASPHFIWDSYRRLIATFARAVRHLDMEPFEEALTEVKARLNKQCQLGREHADCHIPTHELRDLVATYKELFQQQTGEPFPQQPETQLWEAVRAASRSWNQEDDGCSSAVTVQSTVFSNYDFRSAVGVTFTGAHAKDDEADGSDYPELLGKWLVNAQSEDLVRDRIPQEVTQEASFIWAEQQGIEEAQRQDEFPSLEETMPGVFAKLLRWQDIVDNHFSDVCGLEFGIYEGRLWLLDTYTDESKLRELFFSRQVSDQSLNSMPMREISEDFGARGSMQEELPCEPAVDAVPEMCGNVWDEVLDNATIAPDAWLDTEAQTCPMEPLYEAKDSTLEEQASLLSMLPDLCRKVTSGKRTPYLHSPTAMMRRALSRLVRGRKQQPKVVQRSTPLEKHEFEIIITPKASKGAWTPPCGLDLWQTALAGGAAAVACRGLGMSMDYLEASMQRSASRAHGSSPSLLRAFSLQHGLRSFLPTTCSSFGPLRAFPFGAICCTLYTNLCSATPADKSPVCRLGCAASAVLSATMVTGAYASRGKFWFPKLTTLMPTMAIEMCTIDLVRNAAVDRGHDISPAVLVTSGAVAGTVAQTFMHPLKAFCRQGDAVAIAAPGPGATTTALRAVSQHSVSTLFAGLGPACARSAPIVAMNSLVRVGLTTHFMCWHDLRGR